VSDASPAAEPSLSVPRLAPQATLFLVGAVVGTALDRIHVAAGVLWYARPMLAGQAIWVPLVFGLGGLAMVNGQRLFSRGGPPAAASSLVAPSIALLAAYVATAVASDSPGLLAAGLTLAWIVRVARRPPLDGVAAALALAVAGPLVEAALSATGGFFYRRADLLGVPLWLPALYLHVSPLAHQIDAVFRPSLALTSCRRS
jgi:hypothetical protein